MQSGNLDSKDTRLRLYMKQAPPLSGKGELTTYYLPAAWTYWLLILLLTVAATALAVKILVKTRQS